MVIFEGLYLKNGWWQQLLFHVHCVNGKRFPAVPFIHQGNGNGSYGTEQREWHNGTAARQRNDGNQTLVWISRIKLVK